MPRYDADFSSPPAPVAHVTVYNWDATKQVTEVPMLLDTGADATLLPHVLIGALGLTEIDVGEQMRLVGFDGSISRSIAVPVQLRVFDKTFRGEFLVTDNPYGILGRDILNYVRIVFDGPSLTWDEGASI